MSLTALLMAGVEAALAVAAAVEQQVLLAAFPLVGAGFVAVGAVAWDRRPSNPTGSLLTVTGLLVLGAALSDGGVPDLPTRLGVLLGETPIAATLHVVLAFPSGRLASRVDRGLVQALYVLVLVRQLPVAVPGPDLEGLRLACSLSGAAVIVVASLRLIGRVRRERRGTPERTMLTGVYLYGGGLLLFFPLSARVLVPLLAWDSATLAAIQTAGLAVLPVVFAAGLLTGGFARTGELDELASWLGSRAGDETSLRDVLAQVIGDPSLQLHFARPDSDVFAELAPAELSPAELSHGRGLVSVAGADGRDTGVSISYDRVLFADPAPVERAGRVVAVALERERLRADLLAEQAALRASRARVVEFGDLMRRELAQDLHDLLQSRLTLAAMTVGRLAMGSEDSEIRAGLDGLRGELDTLITEFRRVVHGVMPALLVERGLAAAVEDLVDRLPVPARLRIDGADRLPPVVASNAYFILTEALTNAVRHSGARQLVVEVVQRDDVLHMVVADDGVGGARATGAGLRGVADRVGALDGELSVTSPPSGGTRVEVVVPCGW